MVLGRGASRRSLALILSQILRSTEEITPPCSAWHAVLRGGHVGLTGLTSD